MDNRHVRRSGVSRAEQVSEWKDEAVRAGRHPGLAGVPRADRSGRCARPRRAGTGLDGPCRRSDRPYWLLGVSCHAGLAMADGYARERRLRGYSNHARSQEGGRQLGSGEGRGSGRAMQVLWSSGAHGRSNPAADQLGRTTRHSRSRPMLAGRRVCFVSAILVRSGGRRHGKESRSPSGNGRAQREAPC